MAFSRVIKVYCMNLKLGTSGFLNSKEGNNARFIQNSFLTVYITISKHVLMTLICVFTLLM